MVEGLEHAEAVPKSCFSHMNLYECRYEIGTAN